MNHEMHDPAFMDAHNSSGCIPRNFTSCGRKFPVVARKERKTSRTE